MTVLSLYYNELTFKRTRNFNGAYFFYFRFYTLLRCDFLNPPKPCWSFFMDGKIVTNSEINLGGRTVSECAPTDVRAKTPSHILKSIFIPHKPKLWSKVKFSSLNTSHEAIFPNLGNTRASYLKTLFQNPVSEFDVKKKIMKHFSRVNF